MKVVLTGPFGAGKSTFIRTVSEATVLSAERPVPPGGEAQKPATNADMDYGRIRIDPDLSLYLFGTPGQDRFDFMWDILGEGLLGYIVLLDAGSAECLAETVPIVRAFRRVAKVPYVVALNRIDSVSRVDDQRVREALDLPDEVPVVACDAADRESVKGVLLELLFAAMDPSERAAAAGA